MTNKINTVLYCGVTSDLIKRVWQHKNKEVDGFTSRYNLTKLVYYEIHESSYQAISREKNIKNWKRRWKDDLIKKTNPELKDLYEEIIK